MILKKILKSVAFLLGILVVCAGTSQSADALKPPSIHVDKGACPFECCTYREWVARTDITLVNVPDGSKALGQIKKGEKVLALTGEIHSVPVRVVSPHDYPDAGVKAGDTIYILHYVGEGFWKVWHDGKLVEIDDFPSKVPKPKATWWVRLKTVSGAVGWTVDHHNFDNQDACG
jgi:hypothetical protein